MNNVDELGNSFEEKGLSINLIIPIVIKDKGIFYNQLSTMHYNITSVRSGELNLPEQTSFSGFIFRTGYIYNLSKDRTIDFFLMPRFMTDFKATNSYHFQMGGIISASKKFSENFNLRIGILYNKDKFGDFYNPLISMYWKISPKLTFTCSLPFISRISYTLNDKSTTGIFHFSPTTSYTLGENSDRYLERNSIDAGVFYRHKIKGNFYLEGAAGRSLGHYIGIYDRDQIQDWTILLIESNEKIPLGDVLEGDHFFGELKFIYNIPLN